MTEQKDQSNGTAPPFAGIQLSDLAVELGITVKQLQACCLGVGLSQPRPETLLDEPTHKRLRAMVSAESILPLDLPAHIEAPASFESSSAAALLDLPATGNDLDLGLPRLPPPTNEQYEGTIVSRGPQMRRPHAATPQRLPTGEDYGETYTGRPMPSANPGSGSGSLFAALGGNASRQFICELGHGGMGIIELAYDRMKAKYVAVKRIREEFRDEPSKVEMFLTEARSIFRLEHNCIVRVYEVGEDTQGPFLLMQYVEGPYASDDLKWAIPTRLAAELTEPMPNPACDLKAYVKREGKLPLQEVIELGINLCSAVAYAHEMQVVHRDIKPENVLLNRKKHPFLTDFGLAQRDDQPDSQKRSIGLTWWTPGYGAPEQETDVSMADARADVYSLGATLYFAATGQTPGLAGKAAAGTTSGAKSTSASAPGPGALVEPPAVLRDVLNKAMKVDRQQRYQSANELARALQQAMDRARMTGAGETGGANAFGALAEIPVGTCFKCGHGHIGNVDARKFCEKCGSALTTPCRRCKHSNAVWSRFCGGCSSNMHAQLADARSLVESFQAMVPEQIQRYDLEPVRAQLATITAIADPRMEDLITWARSQDAVVEQAGVRGQELATVAVLEAQALVDRQEYQQAVDRIGQLPQALQAYTAPNQVRLHAQSVLARIDLFCLKIKKAIAIDDYTKAGAQSDVLMTMRADHPEAKIGKAFLARRWKQVQDQEFSRATISGELSVLEQYLDKYKGKVDAEEYERIVVRYRRMLRQQVIKKGHNDESLRQKYLAWRSPEQAKRDSQRARVIITLSVSAPILILGPVIGGVVSRITDNSVVAILIAAGIVGCIVGALAGGKD